MSKGRLDNLRRAGLNAIDREQDQVHIAHFDEQAVQCSLVQDPAGKHRCAVFVMGQGEVVKPARPVVIEVSL